MCECVEYTDGSRFRCVVCEDMARADTKLVPLLLAELQAECHCSIDYKMRGMTDPGCHWCDYPEVVKRALDHFNGRDECPTF